MNDCEFIRIVTKNDEECFLLTKLKNEGQDGFDLTLCHNGKVFAGSVSNDDLHTQSGRLKIEFPKYVKQTVEALTMLSGSEDTFQYQLKKEAGKDGVEFIWKKSVPDEDITFQLGSVVLKSRTDSALVITEIFNHCIEGMEDLMGQIQRLESDNQRLSQERINALKRLEKCVVAKEELEQDLYTKFALVLNSKKEKIRQLKNGIADSALSDGSEGPEPLPVGTASSTKRLRGESSPQKPDAESDAGTDEEIPPQRKRARGTQQQPTKKRVSDGHESLVLGSEEEELAPTARPRRQRGRPQKKQTPAKPVLPRIGSNESTPGGRSRLRKSGSSRSNQSSENVDADDLMDEL